MKRFTETAKWSDPWFRGLAVKQKALWLWLCDNCDCAGVLPEIDWGLVSFQIGETCTADDLAAFAERMEPCGRGFWLRKFVAFQWGYISEEAPSMPHRGVLKALEKVGIPLAKAIESLSKPYQKGYQTLKDKDKDKVKDTSGIGRGSAGISAKSLATPQLSLSSEPKPAKEPKTRPRDPLMDALATVGGGKPAEVTQWAPVAVAMKQIKAVAPELTPAEISRRAENYRTHYPDCALTPTALAKHWALCDSAKGGTIRDEFGSVRTQGWGKEIHVDRSKPDDPDEPLPFN